MRDLLDVLRKIGPGAVLSRAKTGDGRDITVVYVYGLGRPRKDHPLIKIDVQTIGTPHGAVLRILLTVYDDPVEPMHIEAFANPDKVDHVEDWLRLDEQAFLPIVFLDVSGVVYKTAISLAKLKGSFRKHYLEAEKYNNAKKVKGVWDFAKAKAYVLENFSF